MGPALRGAAVTHGGQGRPPLQSKTGTARSGTSRTPSPTHSVIARSEATRQSVLPSPKRRIPEPVTRSLARNDSAARRRDGGTHGSRPTGCGGHSGRTGSSAPTKQNKNRAKRDVEDAVPYEITRGMCAMGRQGRPPLQGRTGTVRSGTAGTACPTNRRGAARTAKFRNFFFPLSASAGLRRLYSDDTGRPPVL